VLLSAERSAAGLSLLERDLRLFVGHPGVAQRPRVLELIA
jgi:hypothetical protein